MAPIEVSVSGIFGSCNSTTKPNLTYRFEKYVDTRHVIQKFFHLNHHLCFIISSSVSKYNARTAVEITVKNI